MSATTTTPRRHSGHQGAPSSAATTFASSSTAFTSRYSGPCPSTFLHRSSSPTRVTLSPILPVHSVLSLDRSISPTSNRSLSVSSPGAPAAHKGPRRTCMCSPTTHPGSFRCSLHKSSGSPGHPAGPESSYSPNRLNARRSAMTNSLVRICGVEGGDLVKRALAALIRPSSHHQRRRSAFQPRPSRLSVMSKA